MDVDIEVEAMPSREDLDALVRRAENSIYNVCKDDNTNNDSINTNMVAGSFILISDEEMKKIVKHGLVKRRVNQN